MEEIDLQSLIGPHLLDGVDFDTDYYPGFVAAFNPQAIEEQI